MHSLDQCILMVCAADHERTHLGTAWVCDPGLAITAWHVVERVDRQLLWCAAGEASARCIGHSAQYDVALLRFDERKLAAPALPMNDDGDMRRDDAWHSWGYPLGHPGGFPLNGTVSSPRSSANGMHHLVLNCAQGPKPFLRGLSGAPVLDARGAVIGVLTGYPEDLAQITLFATRLDDAWTQLPKWRDRASPHWLSTSTISNYFSRQEVEWDRPTHRLPFLRRAAPRLSDIFTAPRFRAPHNPQRGGGATPPRGMRGADSLLDVLYEDTRHLVLRGDPGTGKSVLLRWLALLAVKHWRTRHARKLVPIIVHAAKLVASDWRAVLDAELHGDAQSLPPGASWLLMVDGLDEVVNVHDRSSIVERLLRNMLSFRSSPLRLLIASRPLASLDEFPPSLAQHFVLQPFTDLQLEAFASAWFSGQAQHRLAQEFMEELRLSRIEGLAAIPALATMAAVVFERSPSRTLPRRRSELYDRFIDLMLQERGAKAWEDFENLCVELNRSRDGKALANVLWGKRLDFSRRLAVEIQAGKTGLGADDFVQPLVRIAQEDGVLPIVPFGSVQADQQWVLMNDLMLGCGLFISGVAGRLEYFHNTIREALAAQSITADTPPQAAAMWPIVRTWSEPRWREIVLLALARWSEQGEAAQSEIWLLLAPLMERSRSALQFVGMALAQGVQLPPENEAQVTAALFNRLGSWNPCAELFSEFRSPNPLDVLRLLTRRERFVELLLKEFDENPEQCAIRTWAFLELTLDQAGSRALRRYLDAEPGVALAAATLLVRAGDGEAAAPPMIEALRYEAGERKRREADEWRVAEVIAEYCSREHLRAILESGDIPPDTRFAAAAAGWRRYRDDEMAAQARELLGFCDFYVGREGDIPMLRRALAVPGIVQRPPLKSSTTAVLAAMSAPGMDTQPCATWVYALCSSAAEPAVHAYAQAARIFAEPAAPIDTDAMLLLLQDTELDDAARTTLMGSLGHARRLDILDRVVASEAVPLTTRFAAMLAWIAADGDEAPRARIVKLLAQLRGTSKWDNCVVNLGRTGQVDLAADECLHALVAPGARGGANEIRNLMDMGCAEHIVRVIRASGIGPITAQFAVRCLGQLGDAPRLVQVMQDRKILAAVRLHAVKTLAELGWMREAADQARGIAQEIGEPPERTVEDLEGIAMAGEVVSGRWAPAVLVAMAEAAKMHFPVWSESLLDLLAQPGVSGEDAVGIMKVLGHGQVPLEQVLLRCRATPGDGMPLRSLFIFASDEDNFGIALLALGALCGDEDEERPHLDAAWMLHKCSALMALPKPPDDNERARMLQWVAQRAGLIWLGLLRTGVLNGMDLVRSLEALAATGQEKCAAQEMLLETAMREVSLQTSPVDVWAAAAPYALALERTGDMSSAARVARMPFKQGAAFDLATANCVKLALLLARCRSIALVKSELRMIALHAPLPMTVRVEAATALARKVGGKEHKELLAMLQA